MPYYASHTFNGDIYFPPEKIQRVREFYKCSEEDAVTYLLLKEEGYSTKQAALMAGISDPSDF
jgi:hypothetical protein